MLRYLADQTILAVCICLLHTARIIWSVLLTFLATLMVNSIKKVRESFWCSCSITCKGKRTDWILKIFTFNNKNPLYLPLISTLQFFEGQRHKGLTQLATESFGMPQWRIVSLSLKNARFFLSFFFFDNTSLNFWDQSPSPHYQCCLQVSGRLSWRRDWFISKQWDILEFQGIFSWIDLVLIIYVKYCKYPNSHNKMDQPGITCIQVNKYIKLVWVWA